MGAGSKVLLKVYWASRLRMCLDIVSTKHPGNQDKSSTMGKDYEPGLRHDLNASSKAMG